MTDMIRLGCKKCGAAMEFQVQIFPTKVTLAAGDNTKFESFFHKGIEVVCKQCKKTAAMIDYKEMTN